MKQLLLLGGGHAHVHVLKVLAEQPLPGAKVTLVSPHAAQTYSGMVPGYVAGHYALADCAIPLAPLANAARVSLVEGTAVALDATKRRVTLADGQTLAYDTLSLDTGPVMDRDSIPGAREHALFVRPIEQFTRLWEALLDLAGQHALSVVVVGAGAAGVELAMALQFRLGERARVSLVTGGTPPLASHPVSAQRRAMRALKRCGVTVFEEVCVEIGSTHVSLERGMRLACDAPVMAVGVSPPVWLAGSGLALDDKGFVATVATLQSSSHPEVFAAGDVASRADAPHPRSGVYAVRAGPPLALNLRRQLGGGKLENYQPQRRSLNLLACGRRSAIASWGEWAIEGRWVWHWKDHIDRAFVARYRG